MDAFDALAAAYESGKTCEHCKYAYHVVAEPSKESAMDTSDFGRACMILDDFGDRADLCPAVEDEHE